MRVVKSRNELEMNLSIFDGYLNEGTDAEYHFAIDLLKKGNSFVAYQTNGKYLFSKLLVGSPSFDKRLEEAYLNFVRPRCGFLQGV